MLLVLLLALAFLADAIGRELDRAPPPPSQGVQESCPDCGCPSRSDWLYCPHCRRPLRGACGTCGRIRVRAHRFCVWCGVASTGGTP